jgi:site-specific recombinase XerC
MGLLKNTGSQRQKRRSARRVISPLPRNIYLTQMGRQLERAKDATRWGKYIYVAYARIADSNLRAVQRLLGHTKIQSTRALSRDRG